MIEQVIINVCSLCLDEKGGECHSPGCLFYMTEPPAMLMREIVMPVKK